MVLPRPPLEPCRPEAIEPLDEWPPGADHVKGRPGDSAERRQSNDSDGALSGRGDHLELSELSECRVHR